MGFKYDFEYDQVWLMTVGSVDESQTGVFKTPDGAIRWAADKITDHEFDSFIDSLRKQDPGSATRIVQARNEGDYSLLLEYWYGDKVELDDDGTHIMWGEGMHVTADLMLVDLGD
jgi:hypothetical protein